MNFFNISCKKATYLISKKEEDKLSWIEKIQLRGHLTICSLCRKFELQTGWIGKQAGHVHGEVALSEDGKERISSVLGEAMGE